MSAQIWTDGDAILFVGALDISTTDAQHLRALLRAVPRDLWRDVARAWLRGRDADRAAEKEAAYDMA